ncbi:MAG TPA: alpha/beta hydrolase [Alphaproteobacteria bacterium]
MPLHPQSLKVLEAAAKAGSVFDAEDPVEARRRYDAATPLYRPQTPPLHSIEERVLPGPGARPRVRLYAPQAAAGGKPLPALVYFHGGGWVFGNLDSHDAICRTLADRADCRVVSVDYRLAPEHKFPAAFYDCTQAARWVASNAGALGVDPARLAVGGDSAGGNLAAAAAIAAREAGGPAIAFQLLIYPATDMAADTESKRLFATGHLLTAEAIARCRGHYLNNLNEAGDWRASPARAPSLANLPPAFIQTAEFDPLRDEGKAYAEALEAAGVPVAYKCYPGMLHGFVRMGALIDMADEALEDAAKALRTAWR